MNLNLNEPKNFNLGEFNRKAISEIEFILHNKIKGKFDCVIIVLPN
jgi:hypothetical protein